MKLKLVELYPRKEICAWKDVISMREQLNAIKKQDLN